jgi:PKD repeat protein
MITRKRFRIGMLFLAMLLVGIVLVSTASAGVDKASAKNPSDSKVETFGIKGLDANKVKQIEAEACRIRNMPDTVKNAAKSNTVTKSGYIIVKALRPPVAAFSALPISGKVSLSVKFTDKSTGSPDSWSWNFGDKCTSKVQSPVHKYTKAGKYTVSLTVKNAVDSSTKKMFNYILVK